MTDSALSMAIGMIQSFESCKLAPHLDTVASSATHKVYDIGWGSCVMPDGAPVHGGCSAVSQADADAMLAGHVAAVLQSVRAMVRPPLEDHQAAALTSLAYNIGTAALRSSTLINVLNQRRFKDAAARFCDFVYAGRPLKIVPGLVTRRTLEMHAFTSVAPKTADDLNNAELKRITGAKP